MTCVYCNCHDNLNTELTITLDDGNKVTVQICDNHSEDATVKTARVAYQNKQAEIEAVLAQAKALGLNITQSSGGLTIAQAAHSEKPKQSGNLQNRQIEVQPKNDQKLEDQDFVSTDLLDSRSGIVSVGGSVNNLNVESMGSHDMNKLSDKLGPDARKGFAKLEMVEGRGGQPIAIPKFRKDGTGTTNISVIKTNDGKLQESFKRMANDSMNDRVPNFARAGYSNTTRNCTFCSGDGEVQNKTCPKCNGTGIISVY